MAGSNETKANSAQFQVKLPTGAELGKNKTSGHELGIKLYVLNVCINCMRID